MNDGETQIHGCLHLLAGEDYICTFHVCL